MSLKSNSSPPLALFFGDAHLDTGAWANRPQLVGDSMAAFRYICRYAIRNGIDNIFGAGDLIDVKKPHPEVVQFARSQMDELEAKGVHFYFIQGQHEYSADLPWFCAIHDHPEWLNERATKIGEFNVYGMDWRPAEHIAATFERIPHDADILMAHQVWEEFMGDKCGCEASFANVPNVHTVFTGDYHVNKQIRLRNASGEAMSVYSPGSTNMRKIDEPYDKFFYVLHMDGTWTRVRIPTRRKIELFIRDAADLEDFPDDLEIALKEASEAADKMHLSGNLRRPFCRIVYNDELENVYQIIKDTVPVPHVELFLKPIPGSEPEEILVNRQTFDQAASGGLIGMLSTVVKPDTTVHQMFARLLGSTDPKLELQQMKKERGLT